MARFSVSPPHPLAAPTTTTARQPSSGEGLSSSLAALQWKWNFPPQDPYFDNDHHHHHRRHRHRSDPSVDSSDDGDGNDDSDDDDSSVSSSSSSSHVTDHRQDEISNANDSDEEEPPHPLGFGTTRFGILPSLHLGNNNNNNNNDNDDHPRRVIFNMDDHRAWNALIQIHDNYQSGGNGIQSYNLDLRGTRLPSKALLRGHASSSSSLSSSSSSSSSSIDRIAELVAAASLVDSTERDDQYQPTAATTAAATTTSSSRLLQLAQACEDVQNNIIPQHMLQRETNVKQTYKSTCNRILLLLQADMEQAEDAKIRLLQRKKQYNDAELEYITKVRQEEEAQLQHTVAIQEHKAQYENEIQDRKVKRQEQIIAATKQAELDANRQIAHITRAIELITAVTRVRSIISIFDTASSVSKRRLSFKKLVNGKINTLSTDSTKIMDVANSVIRAVQQTQHDDEVAESGGGGGGDAVMSMGKRYLLDLLCCNLIVRVQADGFNGTRGDGYPLASLFATVHSYCSELGPLLEGHLYKVCPMAIPALSLNPSPTTNTGEEGGGGGGGEDELMERLGMIRENKTGQFETFDKFLHRTEGLISIMANIMASYVPNNNDNNNNNQQQQNTLLLGGHVGALQWLRRILELLPPKPTHPLPLLTAPVLVAFLTSAGHMLANRYPTEFANLLSNVQLDVLPRLDDSTVGIPSATRLRKVLYDVGFVGLQKDLPKGGVSKLYDTETNSSSGTSGSNNTPFSMTAVSSTAMFGQTNDEPPPSMSSTFGNVPSLISGGGGAGNAGGDSISHSNWGSNNSTVAMESIAIYNNTTSVWGPPSSSTATVTTTSSPFVMATPATVPPITGFAPAMSPFGGGLGASAPAVGVSSLPTTTTNSVLFGTTPAAPFGTTPAAPFGMTATSSGIGVSPTPAPLPFGTLATTTGLGLSPFGQQSFRTGAFGGGNSAPSPSLFGQQSFGTAAPTPSFGQQSFGTGAFGGGSAAPTPSPFSTNSGCWQGGTNSNSSSGQQQGHQGHKQPCKFFASGNCNFGDRCKFSHDIGGMNHRQIGGRISNPFGNMPDTGGGGGGGNPSRPMGGGKQICKFFAIGQCKNGSECRFSHELPNSAGTSSFGSSSTPLFGVGESFGNSNPSPFSGGGGAGGFGSTSNSNPFGAPRR